ncbi:hypothetical protein BGZ58_001866 [Dissophora ornata]|nr:hypothetical protein BGZ58_001866 [Dissophora ornata]
MDLSWLTIHDSLPCMQSITMDALNLTMDLDHFMTTIAVHTPSLESILVENGMSLGFKAFVQSLDAWSHLSTCSLRLDILDTAKDDNFEAMEDISRAWRERGESKQYPRVHTFELMHVDIEYEARRLLARMFSNARTLTLYPPSSLWYETIEQDMAKDQSQTLFPEGKALDEACMSLEKENLSRPFPSLICLKTSDVLEEHLNALPWILGHQSDQGNGKKTNTSHRLQGLELIDWEIRDYDLEQLSTTLDDYSVTLRRLSFKQWGRFDIDLADFFTKRCCRELTDLRFFGDETFTGAITRFLRKMLYVPQQLMEEHEGMLWDDMLDTPRPVMLVGTFQTTTAASEPVPAPLFYSVSWRKTLTTLHLGYMDIRQDDMHNVNKLLKLLPKLVEFLLDCMLMDMGLFDGLGREVELGQCQGQLGEKGGMLPSRMDFEHERPFLERMSLRLDGSFIYTEDECKALLWTKFRFLEGLAIAMASLTLYHNPHCGTCVTATPLLEAEATKKGFQLEKIEFRYNPLTSEQVEQILTFLGADKGSDEKTAKICREFLRKDAPQVSSIAEAQKVVAEDPALMQRPLVVNWAAKKAMICRPADLIYEMTKDL